MKRLSKMAFILLAGLIVLSFACGKPCSGKIVKCQPHPLYLKYFGMYQLGNYWIYETEDGSLRDSLYVESIREAGGKLNEKTCEEYYSYSVVGMLYNSTNNFRLFNVAFEHKNSCVDGEIRFYYKSMVNTKINVINQHLSGEYSKIISEMVFDTLFYQDILHITVEDYEYFFAPGTGLIKFIVPDQQNGLIKYNLKEYYLQ